MASEHETHHDYWRVMHAGARAATEEKIDDIRQHPDQHQHDYAGLVRCSMINGAIDVAVMEAHAQYVNIGTNGGARCDVTEGPCACGAWH
jgi:hypothetical protein